MNVQNIQMQMQEIINSNPRPRVGFEEIVLLDEMERFNKACLDYMETFDLPRIKGLAVVLYSKPTCLHCNNFKQWLEARCVPYTLRLVDEDFTREWLLGTFPAKLYPVVTICGIWYPDIEKAKMRILGGVC